MGQDIQASAFTARDFAHFAARIRRETELLETWLATGRFDLGAPTLGFELEACLVRGDMAPAPQVEALLGTLADPLINAELATFNVELNSSPTRLHADAFSRQAAALGATLQRVQTAAATLESRVLMIGILPTVRPEHLTLALMTPRERYRALNAQVFALRHGRPLDLHISGASEQLAATWTDVMLEAATTSFQIHLKVTPRAAPRVYNASKIVSGPMVAISANSPYLFGRDLWDETRIPLFEQAVSVGGAVLQERVGFGFRYAQTSILETFQANIARYPPLLPQLMDTPLEHLAHLRLHNGTIWRWNRPLIGFNADGRPHLRIEHRVLPAGPTLPDLMANAAFYCGIMGELMHLDPPLESRVLFLHAQQAFYRCARDGLDAEIPWVDGRLVPVTRVIEDDLLPLARSGLRRLGVDPEESAHWLGIIAARLHSRQTGARWQRAWVARHKGDAAALTAAYLEHQDTGLPVHTWSLD